MDGTKTATAEAADRAYNPEASKFGRKILHIWKYGSRSAAHIFAPAS
jgi:hypothetical protein